MPYVPLDFEIGLTKDDLEGTHISAVNRNELDRIKQQAPKNVIKIDAPSISQKQVANGQLQKPLATTT